MLYVGRINVNILSEPNFQSRGIAEVRLRNRADYGYSIHPNGRKVLDFARIQHDIDKPIFRSVSRCKNLIPINIPIDFLIWFIRMD